MKKLRSTVALLLALVMLLGVLPIGAADAGMTLKAGKAATLAGETVRIPLTLTGNTGLAGLQLFVTYDSVLTLTDIEAGEALATLAFTKSGNFAANPVSLLWDGQDDDATNGVVATLIFTVAEGTANGKYSVSVQAPAGSVYDGNMQNVPLTIKNGVVTVRDYKMGDVNEDNETSGKDVTVFRRHLAGGYDVTFRAIAGDVNYDGELNGKDITTLRRYLAGGYGIDVNVDPNEDVEEEPTHTHTLQRTAAVAATETTQGNIEYWHCADCGKYFSDENAVQEITQEQTVIAPIGANARKITYNLANGDSYLERLTIENPNPAYVAEGATISLQPLSVKGYTFLGWYDLAGGSSAQNYKTVSYADGVSYLYAHWQKNTYKVQYNSELPLARYEDNYSTDEGKVLLRPQLSSYVFTGWAGEDGKLYRNTILPVGSAGNMTLTANWTSERNKIYTKPTLDEPIICEDEENNVILFTYEIGKILNVPLYTVKDFGYITENGVPKTETVKYRMQTSETEMQNLATTVANATTNSSSWTLSKEWNESTQIDEEWCQQNGYDLEDVETVAKSETGNWYVSNGRSGSTEVSNQVTSQDSWSNQVKINGSTEDGSTHKEYDKTNWKTGGELTYTPPSLSLGFEGFSIGVSGGLGGSLSQSKEHEFGYEDTSSHKSTSGFEIGGSQDHSQSVSSSAKSSASWNSDEGYGGSDTNSTSKTNKTSLSELISTKTGYGKNYINGEENSETQGTTKSSSQTDEYSSSVTYSKITEEEKTTTFTTQNTKPGYHRWIIAGTAHVFAIVGYDMAQDSFFVYNYSIMDDEHHEFEDYSVSSADYTDMQNCVIPFEIPYEVAEYVTERTSYSNGLQVNRDTGVIEHYNGTDECVVIPEYYNVGNGDVVKVTGIDKDAFRNNTNIKMVVLSDFITEIPAYAFENCTSLAAVRGGDIHKIGEGAFSGCTSIEICGVESKVTELGENAFDGADQIFVNAANKSVVQAALKSGAKKLILSLKYLQNGESDIAGMTLTVPAVTEYFELNGGGKTYQNVTLDSDAALNAVNRMSFVNDSGIPLTFTSNEVLLNQVSVSAPGITMVLDNPETKLWLDGTINAQSGGNYTILSKGITLADANPKVVGYLAPSGKLLVCGELTGAEHLSPSNAWEQISEERFNNLLTSYRLTFDANGGTCDTTSVEKENGVKLGTLPTPTRTNYNFLGWFTAAEGGEQATADTTFSDGEAHTLYAHWELKTLTVTFNANGGSVSPASKTATYTQAIGDLPTPTRTNYNFLGWYTAASGGNKVTTSSTFTGDVTLYAHWELKTLTITFNANGGSVSPASKTATYTQAIGTLPTPTDSNYTFIGWYTAVSGGTQVTASSTFTGDVTLYARWRKYTYTLREFKESGNSNESGWIKYDTRRTGWGSWSDWATWNPSNGERNVEYRSVYDHTNYHYYRWTNSSHNAIYTYKETSGSYPCTILEEEWFTYELPASSRGTPIKYNGTDNWANRWVPANYSGNYSTDKTFTQDIYRDEWRYQEPIYTYYYYRDRNLESPTYPTGNNISNIREVIR